MSFKKRTLFWVAILAVSFCLNFQTNTIAQQKKETQSGGLFSEINTKLFGSKPKKEKESAKKEKPVKKAVAKQPSNKKSIKDSFSELFAGKKKKSVEEPQVVSADSKNSNEIPPGAIVYEGDYDRDAPIAPSYGISARPDNATAGQINIKNNVIQRPSAPHPAPRDTASVRLDLGGNPAPSRTAAAPLPQEARRPYDKPSSPEVQRVAPQLTLSRKNVPSTSLGGSAQRLASPTWQELEKAQPVTVVPPAEKEPETTIHFNENPLPPLPDQFTEAAGKPWIGTGVSMGQPPQPQFSAQDFISETSDGIAPPANSRQGVTHYSGTTPEERLTGSATFTAPAPQPEPEQPVASNNHNFQFDEPQEPMDAAELLANLPGLDNNTAPPATNDDVTSRTIDVVGGEEPAIAPPAISQSFPSNREMDRRPLVEINAHGPSKIAVGTRVAYEVDIVNRGDFIAKDIHVNVKFPKWVEVAHVSGTAGSFNMNNTPGHEVSLGEWMLGDMAGGRREKLTVTVIPREKRPFDMDVTWKSRQSSTLARVTVEEPKLEMELVGKDIAIAGCPETFSLKIFNVGNCTAEGTRYFVVSNDDSSSPAVAQQIGDIPAGQMRTHAVQFLAQKPGSTTFRVKVVTDSGTEVVAEKHVKILYSQLELKIAPIPPQYVGAESVYRLYIANTGTAETTDAEMDFQFPPNMELVSHTGAKNPEPGKIVWSLGKVLPGETREFAVTLKPTIQGDAVMKLSANAKYTSPIYLSIPVECHALANLRIDLKVPEKPMLLREIGEYQLRVTNTGSENIHDGKVFFYFSEGMEPIQVGDGVMNGNGIVSFAVPLLAPGTSRTFEVRSQGLAAGKHAVRVQVISESKELDLLEQKSIFYR